MGWGWWTTQKTITALDVTISGAPCVVPIKDKINPSKMSKLINCGKNVFKKKLVTML